MWEREVVMGPLFFLGLPLADVCRGRLQPPFPPSSLWLAAAGQNSAYWCSFKLLLVLGLPWTALASGLTPLGAMTTPRLPVSRILLLTW